MHQHPVWTKLRDTVCYSKWYTYLPLDFRRLVTSTMKVAGSAVMASLQRSSTTLLFLVIQLMTFYLFPELL